MQDHVDIFAYYFDVTEIKIRFVRENVCIYEFGPGCIYEEHGTGYTKGPGFKWTLRIFTRVNQQRVHQFEDSLQHHENRFQSRLQGLRHCYTS